MKICYCCKCKRGFEMPDDYSGTILCEACDPFMNDDGDKKVTIKELLKEYSEYLEACGYLDTDWWQEKPTSVTRFFKDNEQWNPKAEVDRGI